MLKTIAAILLLVLTLGLQSCTVGISGLKSYVDTADGYEFLYPNGWVPINITDGPDVVFRDLIQQTENISVVINSVPENATLADLGTPTEFGYKLQQNVLSSTNANRQVELVDAKARNTGDKSYYLLEYSVKLSQENRHDLATAVISHNKLYTLNASTTEERWDKVRDLFTQVVSSFNVY